MKQKWQQLAGDLLMLASQEFSNHGCNYWKWPESWTPKERYDFSLAIVMDNRRAVFGRDTPSEEDKRDAVDMAECDYGPNDWWVMMFLGKELGGRDV